MSNEPENTPEEAEEPNWYARGAAFLEKRDDVCLGYFLADIAVSLRELCEHAETRARSKEDVNTMIKKFLDEGMGALMRGIASGMSAFQGPAARPLDPSELEQLTMPPELQIPCACGHDQTTHLDGGPCKTPACPCTEHAPIVSVSAIQELLAATRGPK